MIMELLAHKDYLRVLHAIARGPVRFHRLQEDLALHPPQLARALKFLTAGKFISTGPAETETSFRPVVYDLTARGEAMRAAFMIFATSVNRRRSELGAKAFEDVQSCWR